MTVAEKPPLTRKDFTSDQDVRWCPGCGDYAILANIQKTMPTLGIPRENIVFISGIGCSSRFPYYMNTYGIHSIHGRAPTLATGLKCARPDLQVWIVTGDGDGLSIGGNHLLHAIRRNVDINILLFNNRIYGLTKGQYSPTSEIGKRTQSSPDGSIDNPVNPVGVAIGAEASFIARTVDTFQKHMSGVFQRSAAHSGAAFVEIFQNCLIFNQGAWGHVTNPDSKVDNVLYLEHGKPMRFGKEMEKGIRLNGYTPEVVLVDEVGEENLLVHDEAAEEPTLAYLLSRMGPPDFPTPVGVFRSIEKPVYDQLLMAQIVRAKASKAADLDALYHQGDTWEVDLEEDDEAATLTCPACGSRNLPGADECATCQASLMQEDVPRGTTKLERSLMNDTVELLKPTAPVSMPTNASLSEVISQMQTGRIGCMLITDEAGKLCGIFTERDLVLKVAGHDSIDLETETVGSHMTANPETLRPGQQLAYALQRMMVGDFRHLPLTDEEGKPVGVLSSRDIINYIEAQFHDTVTRRYTKADLERLREARRKEQEKGE